MPNPVNISFEPINDMLNCDEVDSIIEFILKHGDRRTYRNIDNDNPHYSFGDFDVFLGAGRYYEDLDTRPKPAYFSELTIADWDTDIRYYNLVIVRDGDLSQPTRWVWQGMKEGNVYLIDSYENGLSLLRKSLATYLLTIRKFIK